MSRAAYFALVLVFSCAGSACADSPLPPPAVHRVTSPDSRIAAVSDPSTGTRVIATPSEKVLWSIPGWFRYMHVSNDGRHLATVYGGHNLIPLNATQYLQMITFWEDGRKIRVVPLKEIVPDRSILQRTVSHYAWGIISGINARNELVVARIDGRELRFDMVTGALR